MVLKRYGVLGILFAVDPRDNKTKFLILHHKKNWAGWELPKGGIEENESEIEALGREVREETGLSKIEVLKRFDTLLVYWDRSRRIQNEHSVFLVRANFVEPVTFEYNTTSEHDGFQWVLPEEALKKLRFADTQRLIRLALEEIAKLDGLKPVSAKPDSMKTDSLGPAPS